MSVQPNQIDELLEQYDEHLNCIEENKMDLVPKPHFEVTDKSSAEWVLRKIAQLKAEDDVNSRIAQEQIAEYQKEIDNITGWQMDERRKLTNHMEFLKSLLEPYHRMILEADPKAKTIKLPHGEMKIRAQQPEIDKDDKALTAWLKLSEETRKFVETKEVPKWGEFKKLCKIENGKAVYLETAEVVDGITATDRPDKFEVVVR
jgi:hypothetical protein